MSRVDSVDIARQTAKGTPNLVMGYFPPVESAGAPQQREAMEIEETLGHRFPSGAEYGTRYFESPWSGAVRVDSFPRILSAFLGNPVSSQPDAPGAPTVYSHLFDPAAAGAEPEWVSLLINRTDPDTAITDLLKDARGNELTITVEPNGYLKFDASFVALDVDQTRPEPVATRDSSQRFTFDKATVFMSVNGGAEVAIPVSSWSSTYSNNLVTDLAVLGSRVLFDLPYGNASCEAKFAPRSGLSEHYRRAMLDDPESVKLRLLVEGAIAEGTSKFEFEHTVHLAQYIEAPAEITAGENLTGIEVSTRAAFDDAAGKFVTYRVQNKVADYSV